MTELQRKIKAAAQAYYTDGSSELTDMEFDSMVDELRQEEPNSPLLKQTGWGYDVDTDSTVGEKFRHTYGKAGSLEKCYNWNELRDEFKNRYVDISLKLDGISVVMYYIKGALCRAVTRGNGTTGIDITSKAHRILKTDTCIDVRFTGAVRGEIVMSHKQFADFCTKHPDAKNPRNTVAGLINSKNVDIWDLRHCDVVVYSVVGCESTSLEFNTITFVRNWLRTNFKCSAHTTFMCLHQSDIDENAKNLYDKWSEEYPCDGIVITEEYLEHNGNAVIQKSQAWKFKSEVAQSKVVNVEWNMSKSGYAIPRVQIETVQLAGTNVSFCTGENAKNIVDNRIGVGAIVEVEKHGEIIPNINKVIKPASELNIPEICPHCNGPLEWDGVHLACCDKGCSNATYHDTMIWTSVLAPVDGLAESLKKKFFEHVYREVPTIETLMSSHTTAFCDAAKGSQSYKMRIMFELLYSDSKIQLVDAIKALNIPRFGDINAAKLAEHPEELRSLMLIAMDGSCGDGSEANRILNELRHSVGDANIDSLECNFFKLSRLRYIWNRIAATDDTVSDKGKVAITGKLSVKRTDFEAELKKAGYIPGSITKDTKFLITDDPTSPSSKNKKADAWGIVKITEAEFRSKYM